MRPTHWWLRIKTLLFRARAERDLDDEVQFHLEMEARKHLRTGASAVEAWRRTRLSFGGVDRVKEECRSARGTMVIDTLHQDIRFALRTFRKSPGFVAVVVGTIAIGLALNTAAFTIFNTYVLRPLAIRDPQSLYAVSWVDRTGRAHGLSYPQYQNLGRDRSALTELAGSRFLFGRVDGHPMAGELVTGNYFDLLGVPPHLGRMLGQGDAAGPGASPVAVISYLAWKGKFGADSAIVGKRILLRGTWLEVIGVASPQFTSISETPRDFWAPLTMAPRLESGPDLFGPSAPEGIGTIGRIRPGFDRARATQALSLWVSRVTADHPDSTRAIGAVVEPNSTAIRLTPELAAFTAPLMVAFLLILLVACANVGNVMLARGLAREREIGVRLALGADRGRLVRQLLTECFLLALPAGLLGVALSNLLLRIAIRMMFLTLPADMAASISTIPLPSDVRVFGFMLLAAMASAVGFGLAPALQATRRKVMLASRGEFSADVRPVRLRSALVVGQVTGSVVLLVCSGVLVRGADAVRRYDLGFQAHGVVVIRIEEKERLRVLERLLANPTVASIAAAGSPPMNGILPSVSLRAMNGAALRSWVNPVSPDYFGDLEIGLAGGRIFTPTEASAGSAVAIVSQRTAKQLWPTADPIGQEIRVEGDDPLDRSRPAVARTVRVIGVSRDVISCCVPYGKDPAIIYLPVTPRDRGTVFLLRVKGNTEAVRGKIDAELSAAIPGAIEEIHPLDQYVAAGIYPFRAASWISSFLGVLSLLLTLSGIYGVLSYLISQRTREIGIRVALGAGAASITRLVLSESMRMVMIGVLVGTTLALGASKLLSSNLLFVNTFDSLAYFGGTGLVLAAAAAAALVPTQRATRIDPVRTLRSD